MASVENRHTATFLIRHDECDSYGVLNNATYLRLAQETAWRHSEAVGFPPDYYEQRDRAWVARDSDIEYLKPVRHGDEVAVTTSIVGWRRTAAKRRYEFRVGDQRVAEAHTIWVYFDVARGVPTAIPAEIVDIITGDEGSAMGLDRTPFPDPPPAPPGAVAWRRRVEWSDVDPYGHLNNATYLAYTQEAAIEAGRVYGVTRVSSSTDGLGWALKHSRIEYLQPALPEEELEIRTWLSSLRKASAVRHYEIVRISDGGELARAESLWLTVDLVSGKPRRLPQWMQEALAPNVGSR